MFDRNQLAALAAVHRTGAFDRAAAQLSVTPSAVSQRIKALEDRAGAVLIRRGQPCTATDIGLRLVRHAEELALLEAAVAADLGQPAAPATLRIAVNADSLATWAVPALASVEDALFDLVIDDQDHLADRMRRGEVLAAITAEAAPVQGYDSHPLGRLRYRATASPAFVARHLPDGPTPAALFAAPALTFNEKDRLQRDWLAQVTGQRRPFPSHRMESSQGFVDAALAGMGWGMNPEPLVRDHLAAGRLVELVSDQPIDVMLHWQVSRLSAPVLGRLTRAIRAAAAPVLLPPA